MFCSGLKDLYKTLVKGLIREVAKIFMETLEEVQASTTLAVDFDNYQSCNIQTSRI